MPKFTVRRTVTAGVLGVAALGMLALPAVANAETPDSIAGQANTGSAGSSTPARPGVTVTQDRDGNVVQAAPGHPVGPDSTPAMPLQPAQPGGVTVVPNDHGAAVAPGSPADTITIAPLR